MKKDKRFLARGRVVVKEDQKGVLGLQVIIFDKDHLFDDRLGRIITNEEGDFILQYRGDYHDINEKAPDLYIKVLDCGGNLLHSSEDAIVWDAGQTVEFRVAIPRSKLEHHLKNMRLLPRLSGGIVAQEKLNVIDQAIHMLDARGEIGPTTPLGSRPFGPGGQGLVPFGAWYCAAPDIFVFADILDIAWGVIDNHPCAILDFVRILDTLIHRHKVKHPWQFAAASERWRKDSQSVPEALGKLMEAKRELLVENPSETLIEKERYLPVIMAAVLAARDDRNVENRYIGILLGELSALGQMDLIYRGALYALRCNPAGIESFRNLLGYIGGTCGPDDGPIPFPLDPNDIRDVDEFWRIEKWFCTAEAERAIGQLRGSGGSYEIHDVDWGDGCPGSPVVITGENFTGFFPDKNRVIFIDCSGTGKVEAAPEDYLTDWTDTRIEVPLPEEAGPGPISLHIEDNFATACGMSTAPARRGRGATFNFDGGAAYIRVFTANGDSGRVRVDPGETATLRWVVVPSGADVRLEVSRGGVIIENRQNLNVEDRFYISIPAEAYSETVCTLTANNVCSQLADVHIITLFGYSNPALAIAGIEITQAIQHFNIVGDTSQNNSLRLAEGKRTLVRVYVDSGRRDGFDAGAGRPDVQANVTGHLTVVDIDTDRMSVLSPVNPGLSINAPPLINIMRDNIEHSLNFALPVELVRGRKRFHVRVESRSPSGDLYSADESVETSFYTMDTMRLVRILCTDNNTGNSPTRAGWNAGRQGARTRYPLASDGIQTFIAPGNVIISTDEDLATEDGWEDLLHDLRDIAEDYEDGDEYFWCMAIPDDSTYLDWAGLSIAGAYPRFIFRENLPATFAHELGHAHDIDHSNCGNPDEIDDRLPADGHYHDTGVDVYTYRAFPPDWGEIMSYCDGPNGRGNRQNRWPSAEFWNILFDIYRL